MGIRLVVLVEQVHLLPLNPAQLNSKSLWNFIERGFTPAMRAVGDNLLHNPNHRFVEDLVS